MIKKIRATELKFDAKESTLKVFFEIEDGESFVHVLCAKEDKDWITHMSTHVYGMSLEDTKKQLDSYLPMINIEGFYTGLPYQAKVKLIITIIFNMVLIAGGGERDKFPFDCTIKKAIDIGNKYLKKIKDCDKSYKQAKINIDQNSVLFIYERDYSNNTPIASDDVIPF